jgi:hypothetical protein
MSARVAAYCAVALSFASLIACCLFMPALWEKINTITEDLQNDMNEFRDLQSNIWSEMTGKTRAKRYVQYVRKNRQTPPGQCACNVRHALYSVEHPVAPVQNIGY